MVLLVLGMILCGLCMGCGMGTKPRAGTEPVSKMWREVIMPPEKRELQEPMMRSEEEQVQKAIKVSGMKEAAMKPAEEEVQESAVEPAEEGMCKSTMEPVIGEMGESTMDPIREDRKESMEQTSTASMQPATEKLPAPTAVPLPSVTAEPQVHTHTIVTETLAATCLEAGVIRETCEGCKKILSETAEPPLGHDFIKSVWELPTCQKGGYYNNICSRCGLVECVTQEPLPHEAEDILLQEGNCMEDTVIQHVCKMCGTQIKSDTRYTPYDTHLWVTAMIEGAEITYCERCGVAK